MTEPRYRLVDHDLPPNRSEYVAEKTPWRQRLIFNTRRAPFPYLAHRYSVYHDRRGGNSDLWLSRARLHGFWSREAAERYAREVGDD